MPADAPICLTCHQRHPDMSGGDPEGDPGCDWDTFPGFGIDLPGKLDHHGNYVARDGIDRCACGCKYWEQDRCIDCGAPVSQSQQ